MTSSNGNIFRVTGHLCGEFTGLRWIPRTKASDAGFGVFFDLRLNKRLSKQSWGWLLETLSWSLWRQSNGLHILCNILCFDWDICYSMMISTRRVSLATGIVHVTSIVLTIDGDILHDIHPASTQRNKHVIITLKWRFDVIITCLFRCMLAG